MTAEEKRVEFYGDIDARAYDHDEIYLMESYAKEKAIMFKRFCAAPGYMDFPSVIKAAEEAYEQFEIYWEETKAKEGK